MILIQTNRLQKFFYLLIYILIGQSMMLNTFSYNLLNRHTRIQGCIWILEYHLYLLAEFFLFFF